MPKRRLVAISLGLGLLAACSQNTADLVEKSRGIEARDQLVDAIGRPARIEKVGPIERWTYWTSDGSVTFIITGETVTLSLADADGNRR